MDEGADRAGRHELAVFDTLRSRHGEPTGEAARQRAVIAALASVGGPEERTRTAIARRVAEGRGVSWKNVYSGIHHDLSGVLVPLGLAEEAGRIPPKRGSKAMQESGVPYYHLTAAGQLVALALGTPHALRAGLAELARAGAGGQAHGALGHLAGFAPGLAHGMLTDYVRAYCDGRLDALVPLTAKKIGYAAGAGVRAQAAALGGALGLGEQGRKRSAAFLGSVLGNKH